MRRYYHEIVCIQMGDATNGCNRAYIYKDPTKCLRLNMNRAEHMWVYRGSCNEHDMACQVVLSFCLQRYPYFKDFAFDSIIESSYEHMYPEKEKGNLVYSITYNKRKFIVC